MHRRQWMKQAGAIALATLPALGTACGQPTLDASNETALKASVQKMALALKYDAQKKKFGAAVAYLSMRGAMKTQMGVALVGGKPDLAEALRDYNGKTAEEMINAAGDAEAKIRALAK